MTPDEAQIARHWRRVEDARSVVRRVDPEERPGLLATLVLCAALDEAREAGAPIPVVDPVRPVTDDLLFAP